MEYALLSSVIGDDQRSDFDVCRSIFMCSTRQRPTLARCVPYYHSQHVRLHSVIPERNNADKLDTLRCESRMETIIITSIRIDVKRYITVVMANQNVHTSFGQRHAFDGMAQQHRLDRNWSAATRFWRWIFRDARPIHDPDPNSCFSSLWRFSAFLFQPRRRTFVSSDSDLWHS